jgi:tetratricopeptide (TPR) repeat protein
MARAYARMAYASYFLHRDTELALAHRRQALALYERLHRDFPAAPAYAREVGYAHVDLGNVLKAANRPNEAIDQFRRALSLCERQRTDFPDVPEDRELIAHARHWLGVCLEYTSQLDDAEREYRAAHELRSQLVAGQPNQAPLNRSLALIKTYLAELLMKRGRLGEAGELLAAAVALDKRILEEFPDVGDYRRGAGWAFESYGKALAALGRTQEAEAALRRSVAIRDKLRLELPNVPVHGDDLAGSCYNLGLLLQTAGRSAEATEAFRRALGLWEELLAPAPKTRSCERHLAWMFATCPVLEFRDPQRAVVLAKQSMRSEGDSARQWSVLGIAQCRAADYAAAIESLRKSMGLANGGDAQQWLFLAMSHWPTGDRQQAQQWYQKAVAWIERIHPGDESYVRFRDEAAKLLGVVAQGEGKNDARISPN